MEHPATVLSRLLAAATLLALGAAPVFCGEPEEWPHAKDIRKCPKCPATFDAAPHPYDLKQCPKCQAALNKSLAYVKKHFKPTMFGLLLDSFYGGFVFLMDASENHDKELAVCTKNCREMIKPEPDGNFASGSQIGGDWFSWKKSMAMYFLAEYSLRYGLTPENKAALLEGAKAAAEGQQKGGGWFHSRPKEKQYAPDIAIIGCMFYAAFQEMKALGLDPGPVMEQTRTYLEGVSDGKTIGYGKGWHGGMGGGGADGFITLGLLGSGVTDDKWDAGLAAWMKDNYMDAGHGHANGELHYFGMGAALHRLGPEHYARFATCHIHRLSEIQREDGSIPAMSHDDPNEVEYYQKHKADLTAPGEFPATAVLTCLLLMERPGAFSPLPSKPAGSISNKDALKLGTEALAKGDYAKALKNLALVLPRGDAGELVPQAREQMQKIEAIAREKLQPLQAKDAQLTKSTQDAADSKEVLVAYADMIQQYEKFQRDFEGSAAAQEARKSCEPLQKALSAKRMRMAFTSGGAPSAAAAASAAPAKLKSADSAKEWDGRLKERAAAIVAAGKKVRFDFKALSTRITIQSLAGKDSFKAAMENGGQMDVSWSQLQPADLRSLALELAATQDTPLDHALAAFYLLSNKETARAEDHLLKAGKEGAAVNAAFARN
ncbi:MAG: hypothetical protein NTW87_27900 [Planctomycetota bacterium]|nr:hypothetical protein [Planctomycetota bacterium]